MQDAVGVVDLIDRRGTLRAQATAACRVEGIAFKLADLVGFFVDISEEATGRFAVEAGCRHESRAAFDLLGRPLVWIDLDDIVPRFRLGVAAERSLGRAFRERRRLGNQSQVY